MQPEQGPRRDPARPPAPLGAPGSGRARANSPERSGTTPQGWKLEPGFSCVAPRGSSPLPWLPAAPRAWAALCGRCVRRQPTCPPAQASASGPRAAAAPSASQGSGPLTAGAPGTRVLADQPRPRRGSLRSGPERELAARGRGGGHLRTGPSREWGAAASPGAWASLPLCRRPCGSGAPLPLVTSPALRPRRRQEAALPPSTLQGAGSSLGAEERRRPQPCGGSRWASWLLRPQRGRGDAQAEGAWTVTLRLAFIRKTGPQPALRSQRVTRGS